MKTVEQIFPDYFKGLSAYLKGDHRNFRKVMKSPLLERQQRTLLQVRAQNRERRYESALEILDSVTHWTHDFFKAEQLFLRASIASFLSQWSEGYKHNLAAHELYSKMNYAPGMFLTLHNAASSCINISHLSEAKKLLRKSEAFAKRPSDKLLLLRAWACMESNEENFEKALLLIEDGLSHQSELNAVDQIHMALVGFDIYFRSGNVSKAGEILVRLQNSKTLRYNARVIFEANLFNLYTKEARLLPEMPKSIKTNAEFSLKWKLIQSLQSGDVEKAKQQWKDLCQMFPDLYRPEFLESDLCEIKSLFIQVIEGFRSKAGEEISVNLSPKLQSLYELLRNSKTPLRKEYLITQIWKSEYSPKFDQRFYELIRRFKEVTSLDLRSIGGGYSLFR